MQFNVAIAEIGAEYYQAKQNHAPMNSAHEGYAVILEELDELWDEVKKSPKKRDMEAMKNECIQVGAMCLRFLIDVCEEDD